MSWRTSASSRVSALIAILAFALAGAVATSPAYAVGVDGAQSGPDKVWKAWDLSDKSDSPESKGPSTRSEGGAVRLAGADLSVQSSDNSWRFVLEWDELPYDLDSHLEGYRPDGHRIHVYFSNSSESYSSEAYCTLDHDDTDSYGPETIDLQSSSSFPCYYYIHNYSGTPSIAKSRAVVKVYKGDTLVGTRKVPTTGSGMYWNICAIQNNQITWYDQKVQKSAITDSPVLDYVSFTPWNSTSTGKRKYPDYGHNYGSQDNNLDHFMTNTKSISDAYPNFASMAQTTFPIPGLEYSSASGGCDAAVPQGICVTNDYIILTAYCAGDLLHEMSVFPKLGRNDKSFVKELNVHSRTGELHNPALYVLDRYTGSYIATVEIQDIGSNHVGGIAYDSTNNVLWVATSTEKAGGNHLQELMIPYETFTSSLSAGDNAKISRGSGGVAYIPLIDEQQCLDSASYNAYHPDTKTLWVGNNKKPGYIVGFKYNSNTGALEYEKRFKIPEGGNGAAVVTSKSKTYLLLNVSHGRNKSSTLYCWDITSQADGSELRTAATTGNMVLPPMLEELCVFPPKSEDEGLIYSVYESGATVYGCFDGPTLKKDSKSKSGYKEIPEGRAIVSVDEVCAAPLDNVLHAKLRSAKTSKAKKTRISIACPVNVSLKDEEGNIVESSEYDYMSENDENGVESWIDGDIKTFLVPSDAGYTLDISPYDDGIMGISVVQYDEDGSAQSSAQYDDVELTNAESLSASLTAAEGQQTTAASRFSLSNPEGETVEVASKADNPNDITFYEVNVEADGEGTVSESASIAKGDYHTVEAYSEEGAVFDGWYIDDELVSEEPEYTLWVDNDINIVAKFHIPDYVFAHVSIEGNGSIISEDPTAIVGDEVSLTAVPDEDGDFVGWYQGEALYSDDEQILYCWDEEGDDITAKFKEATVAHVHVAADGKGTVELVDSDEKVGGSATVKANVSNGGKFIGWYVGDTKVSEDRKYTFTIEEDVLLVARFDSTDNAKLKVKIVGSGDVTQVDGDGTGSASGGFLVPDDGDITLEATPSSDDVTFVGWFTENGEKLASTSSHTFTVNENDQVIAWFSDVKIKVTTTISGEHSADVSASPSSEELDGPSKVSVSVDYDSSEDDFLGWYLNGKLYSKDSSFNVIAISDMEFEARFAPVKYATISVDYDDEYCYAWNSDDDILRVGDPCTVCVEPRDDVEFEGWYVKGKCVSADYEYTFTVTQDVTLQAKCKGDSIVVNGSPTDISGSSSAKTNLSGASVTGLASYTYNGKQQKPAPTVKVNGKTLKAGADYKVAYSNNTNAGTAKMTITGIGKFTGTVTKTFKINKAKNGMKVSVKAKSVAQKKLKKAKQSISKALKVTGASGKVTYAKVKKGSSGALSINKSNAKITIKKGTKKGTYKIVVMVKAKGDANHKAASKTVTVKTKVK